MSAVASEPIGPPVGLPSSTKVRFVDVPERRVLLIDGCGDPAGPAFQGAVECLYSVAYALHFALKKRDVDAPIGALEGLYAGGPLGGGDPTTPLAWSLFLPIPDEARYEDIDHAIAEVRRGKRLTGLDRIRVDRFHEGLAAEIMHIGPYSAEAETIARLMAAIEHAGYRPHGRHHEIYIGDPRRSLPEKLRTVIRHPIA